MAALRLVFEGELEAARRQRLGTYASKLAHELISFLSLAEQMEDRHLNPWFDTARYTFDAHAKAFRELAVHPEAEELDVVERLRALARKLDVVTQHIRVLGRENWQEYLGKVASAVGIADDLKSEILGQGKLDPVSTRGALAQVAHSQRVLASLSADAQEEMATKGYPQWERLRDKAAEEGWNLLRLSYLPLPADSVDAEQMRPLAKALHQLELMEQKTRGREGIDQCLKSIVSLSDQLVQLLATRT